MFRVNQKLNLVLVLVLCFSLISGLTLSFVASIYLPFDINTEPAVISCEVTENQNEYVVTNTGNRSVYVRVAVVANWVSQDEYGIIYWQTPEYTVTLKSTDDVKWQKFGDFYYCLSKVEPENTEDDDVEAVSFASIEITGTAPTADYAGKLTVVAEAIETHILSDSWGVEITSDGVSAIA